MSYNCPRCGVVNSAAECWKCGIVIIDENYGLWLEFKREKMITELKRLFPKSTVILSLE
jgi:hypothetical protein